MNTMNTLRTAITALLICAGNAHAQSNAQLYGALRIERTALIGYMTENPAPSVAFIAIGSGVAGFVSNQMDQQTRELLQAAGVGGVIYCLFNASECDRAFGHIVWRAERIHRLEQALRARGEQP